MELLFSRCRVVSCHVVSRPRGQLHDELLSGVCASLVPSARKLPKPGPAFEGVIRGDALDPDSRERDYHCLVDNELDPDSGEREFTNGVQLIHGTNSSISVALVSEDHINIRVKQKSTKCCNRFSHLDKTTFLGKDQSLRRS